MTCVNKNITPDTLSVLMMSDHLNYPMSEVRVISSDRQLSEHATEYAYFETADVYPEWPYRPNARADSHFERVYMQYMTENSTTDFSGIIKHTENFVTAVLPPEHQHDNDHVIEMMYDQLLSDWSVDQI